MKYRFLLACVVACAMAVTLACGSKTPTSATQASANPTQVTGQVGSGTLRFYLKDAPVDAKAVLVTFTEVAVHLSDGDAWRTLTLKGGPSLTCDLIQLSDPAAKSEIAFNEAIPSGHYTQIRLAVASAKLYEDGTPTPAVPCDPALTVTGFTDGMQHDVNVPSDTIKLNQPFDLAAGQTLNITLDFDAAKSIHETGNGKYMMQPVISVVSVQ